MTKNQPLIRIEHAIDASGLPMGRLATKIATLLRGKHKPSFEPHKDEGDIVVVTNVDKVTVVLAIAGSIFGYYLWDLRGEEKER
jgi:large subunit ribosomal protein L13